MVPLQLHADVHTALKPTPGYDCHVSSVQATSGDALLAVTNLDQVSWQPSVCGDF